MNIAIIQLPRTEAEYAEAMRAAVKRDRAEPRFKAYFARHPTNGTVCADRAAATAKLEARILAAITGEMKTSDIAAAIGSSKQTVGAALTRLVTAGSVTRTYSNAMGRQCGRYRRAAS